MMKKETQLDMFKKKPALTAKQRQAKHKKEMQAKGFKQLSLGYVHVKYHDRFKALAKATAEHDISDDLKIRTVTDTSKVDKYDKALHVAKGKIDELEEMLAESQSKLEKQNRELGGWRKLFWRFWFK